MKKNIKIIFVIFLVPILIYIIIISYLIIWKLYETGVFIYKYSYVESVENNDKRYSLYYDYWKDWYLWVIFEHDINYKKYKEVERSKLSLNIYNNNPNDKFIYYYFSTDKAEINIIKNRYLVLSFDWLYHFLYDLEKDKKYFEDKAQIIYKTEKWIKWNRDIDKDDFIKWKKENIDKKIKELINKK